MAKYKYILTVIIILCTITTYAQPAQYTPMTAAGYQMKRLKVDSTLHLPSFCGVPNLRGSLAKEGALAIDTCGSLLYMWTRTGGWDTVNVSGGGGGGSTDTTSLSNRINLKLNISDTASMLSPYLREIDTTNKFVSSVTSLNDSTIRVIKGTTTTDITIKSSETVTNATRLITTVYNNSGVTITKGTVVYINGRHSSNYPTILPSQANSEDNSYRTFALVESDILDKNTGTVIQAGNIGNLNLPTATFTDGDIVYLSPSVLGGITNVKPLAPNHICKLGSVTRAHPTLGSIEVKIENGWQLDELSDVSIPLVPADSVILQFSRVDSLWHDVTINNAIGSRYIKPSDTSVFQRKALSANTIMANNTSGTANATAQNFKQFGNQTYSDSITFTGASNPSGAINHSFRWSQIGNLVTLHITLTYATVGSLSQVAIEIPDGLPTPILPTGLTANNDIIAYGSGYMVTNTTAVAGLFSKVFLRQNTGLTNDYEVVINQASNASYRIFNATIQYFAQ